jgi:alpha-ribazole phosphatase
MSPETVTTVDLLRHGEPEGGVRYRGSQDDPLSETGWGQMRAAVGERCLWDIIVSSPLRRCALFARELGARHDIPVEIEAGFREMSFGDWEGRTAAEILADTPSALERFWGDPVNHPPPGGEALPDCDRRVSRSWQRLQARHPGRHVLVVAHGGVIRMVLRQVLEIPLKHLWRLEVAYATLSRVRIYAGGTQTHPRPLLIFHGKQHL